MLVQTDTRISLKGSFMMSTVIVELIELEMEKIDSTHLVQFLASVNIHLMHPISKLMKQES